MSDDAPRPRRGVLAWALYDWANSAFATTVMAGFFPVFFKQYWNSGVPAPESSFRLGTVNSLASIVVALGAPLLGALADRRAGKKRLLVGFAFLGIGTTAALFFVAQGEWLVAAALYLLAVVGFSAGNVLYDALILDVAEERELDRVSALGYALGYLGGGLLFALNVGMTLRPGWFGLPDATAAVRVSFLAVALWWLVFSLPLCLRVHERRGGPSTAPRASPLREAVLQVTSTLRKIRKLKMVGLFLLGYWLYIDGVDTIIRMAVDYGISIGLESDSLIVALLVTQFVGFPAALVFGRLGYRVGPRRAILVGIAVYLGVLVYGSTMDSERDFYVLAVVVGLVQGGVQSLSRSLYSRIIPARHAAQFFGFYNMLGKFAAVIGPVLMGQVAVWTGSSRVSILSLAALFVPGALLLLKVDEAEGRRAALAFADEEEGGPVRALQEEGGGPGAGRDE